jgi:superfamily II DNA or RNA helicase
MPVAIPEKRALVLKLRDPRPVTSVLPHKFIEYGGQQFVAVPHTLEVWRVLRNLGVKVNGFEPIRFNYQPPKIKGEHAVMPHQIDTAAFLTAETRGYCLSTPRTGKTAATLLALDWLRQNRHIQSALVVAPNSCLHSVWEAEAFGLFPDWPVAVLAGSRARRQELLNGNFALYIINPDGLKVIGKELEAAVRDGRIGAVVFDECTDYGNRNTERWAAANRIKSGAKYCWGLTGTPGGPDNVYGQARLINPGKVPSYYSTWRDMTMVKVSPFKWLPRSGHQRVIADALQPAIRFDKKDLMDLPPLQFIDREAPMSREQLAAYERMRLHMVAECAGATVTADNAAIMTTKLLQIALGVVRGDTDGVAELDVGERLAVLERIIEEAEYKVVVFAPFTAVLDMLRERLSKRWSVAVVDGRVTGMARSRIFTSFQQDTQPHLLLAHPKTVSFGVELSAADTIVFWGPPLNGPFVYQQALERINSMQQKSNSPSIVHLYSSPVERRLFRGIRDGVDINESIVALFRQIISDPAGREI